jgi:hypothetical protein
VKLKRKLIEQKDKKIKRIRIKVKKIKIILLLKGKIEKNNQFNKRLKKKNNQKNKNKKGQNNISQIEIEGCN